MNDFDGWMAVVEMVLMIVMIILLMSVLVMGVNSAAVTWAGLN